MPVTVMYGDNFLVSAALKELKHQVGSPDVWQANCHQIAGASASVASLMPVCDALPFLADKRLVTVEGAISGSQSREGGAARGRGRGQQGQRQSPDSAWDGLDTYVGRMPETTLLVFVEGPLRGHNPLLERLRPVAQIQEFPTPSGEGLARWVRSSVSDRSASIGPGAISLLSQLVGSNLWVMDGELEKLTLYAGGSTITEAHVRELVPQAREASIFNLVDALMEGRYSVALRALARLRSGGAEFSYIVSMLARQLRQVVLARDLLAQSHPPGEIGQRLNIGAEFAVRKTIEQARKHSHGGLVLLYEALLDADLAVKQGRMDEDLALELFISRARHSR